MQIAYQSYGELNQRRDNAILICHALTGDQHVASAHPVTGKPGWWERMVGPGKPMFGDNIAPSTQMTFSDDGIKKAQWVKTLRNYVIGRSWELRHLSLKTESFQ